MRRPLYVCFGVLALVPVTHVVGQQDYTDVEIKTTHVAGKIYMHVGRGGNIGVSVGDDGILMVDDQFAPLADKIRDALKKLGKGKLEFVLNTQWHGDHTGGNPEYEPRAQSERVDLPDPRFGAYQAWPAADSAGAHSRQMMADGLRAHTLTRPRRESVPPAGVRRFVAMAKLACGAAEQPLPHEFVARSIARPRNEYIPLLDNLWSGPETCRRNARRNNRTVLFRKPAREAFVITPILELPPTPTSDTRECVRRVLHPAAVRAELDGPSRFATLGASVGVCRRFADCSSDRASGG